MFADDLVLNGEIKDALQRAVFNEHVTQKYNLKISTIKINMMVS